MDTSLTDDELAALAAAATVLGRNWRAEIMECWRSGRYPAALREHVDALKHLKLTRGNRWIASFEFDDHYNPPL